MVIFQVQAGQNLLGPNVSNMLTDLHEKNIITQAVKFSEINYNFI